MSRCSKACRNHARTVGGAAYLQSGHRPVILLHTTCTVHVQTLHICSTALAQVTLFLLAFTIIYGGQQRGLYLRTIHRAVGNFGLHLL